MSPEELIGIYRGLRMPILGVVFLLITVYVFWPTRRKQMEEPARNMLNDQPEDKPGDAEARMKS
jgi:cbb3-type cytochrome oxidase subunit 3